MSEQSSGLVLVRTADMPGLLRVLARMWFHSAEWSVVAGLKMSRKLAAAAVSPSKAMALLAEFAEAAGVVGELARSVSAGVPLPQAVIDSAANLSTRLNSSDAGDALTDFIKSTNAEVVMASVTGDTHRTPTLRDRGEDLLNRSRDVWTADAAHPAYERILGDLAPDEARILVLLVKSGAQPMVDVRTGGPVGMVNSELIAKGLTMLGPRAGVRYLDRVPAYLNNLSRLGLVNLSNEQLKDPLEYQVVEAQPDVLAAMHSVRFAKIVRRSVHLTLFGEDFCSMTLVDAPGDAGDA